MYRSAYRSIAQGIARLCITLIRRCARWPIQRRTALAHVIGDLAWLLVARRRRIAHANLRACFPELNAAARGALVRRLFRRAARSALDYGVLWFGSCADIQRLVRIEGSEHLTALTLRPTTAPIRPMILLAPHFVGLEAGGLRLATEQRMATIYARQSNAVWNDYLVAGRARFSEPVLIAKHGFDLRTALRALRAGLPLYYLPDMDNGSANSIFAPFFGIATATLPMVSRLARSTGASVVMAVTEQTAAGYVLRLEPPWPDFPGASIEADTARMNHEIERWVRRMPDQYLWTHRRFKTRPPGAPDLYARVTTDRSTLAGTCLRFHAVMFRECGSEHRLGGE